MNSLNERLHYANDNFAGNQQFASENAMLEMVEQNRAANQTADETTPLEEILESVYDLSSAGKDFMPTFNSTTMGGVTDQRLLNNSIHSIDSHYGMSYASGSSIYVTAQSASLPDSSMYVTGPNTSNYQPTALNSYQRSANNDYIDYLLEQKMYNMAPAASATQMPIQEDDNDPSPVYLKFNLPNMPAQSAPPFNPAELNNFQQQVVSAETDVKDDTVRYVQYANDFEETMQPKIPEMNQIQANQLFRQIATNVMPSAAVMNRYPIQKFYSMPHDMERINGAYMAEVLSAYQPLNNAICNFSDAMRGTNLNIQRNVISRKPLQTKQTVKQGLNNHEWSLINNRNSNDKNNNEDVIENSVELITADPSIEDEMPNFAYVDIPFIKDRPTKKNGRKQTLTPLANNEMCFMDNKGDCDSINDFSIEEPRQPIDTAYITFRKKIKLDAIKEDLVDENATTSAGRSLTPNKSNHREVSSILISSDSDSDDEVIDSIDSKCLKCDKCKKMFKTPRFYSIHRKRCEVPDSFADSTYVIEVEYLESEKEDEEDDQPLSSVQYRSRADDTVQQQKDTIEFTDADSSESIDIPKFPSDSSNVTIRRTTRSSQKTTSSSSGSTNSSNNYSSSPKKSKTTLSPNKDGGESKQHTAKILKCDICEKEFRQKSYLMAHKRVHEKTYKCQYCFKTFVIKNAYDTHVLEKCDKIPPVKLKRLRSGLSAK